MATPEGGEGTTQANPAAVAQANPAAVANPAIAEIKAALIEVLRENPVLLRLPEDPRVCTGMFIAEAWGVGLYGGTVMGFTVGRTQNGYSASIHKCP